MKVSLMAVPETTSAADQARWFNEEVHPHDSQLKAYLRGSFPALHDVDDVVQESYLRIWKARAAHPIDSAKGFLFTVARRLALRIALRNRTVTLEPYHAIPESALADRRPNPADAFSHQEKVSLLSEALVQLSPRCREIVIRRKLLGQSQKTVADQLGVSERVVENQLARGLIACEKHFRSRGVSSLNGA